MLAKALNLPGALMEQILRLRTNGQAVNADQLEEAVSQVQQLIANRGQRLLQFVLRYDEMQKHVSIWELHLQDNGQALFSDGQQSQMFSFATPEEFALRAFQTSKSFSEPKPLVIILLTYADTQAGQRRRAADAMPQLAQQLRTDTANTRWFDFSLMGYRPDGPLFDRLPAASTPVDEQP